MLRIANVIEEGKLGGPQVRMVRVASALEDQVETIIVMPHKNSGPFREMCVANGVTYHVMALTRITKEWREAFAYIFFSPIEVLRLARFFQEERIDLVHASGGSWQYKAIIAAKLAGVPSVWHLNDTLMPGWVRRLFSMVQKLATGFIYTSNRVLDYYGQYVDHGRDYAFIPPPVNCDDFDPSNSYSGDDEVIHGFKQDIVVGTVGNVNPVKGLDTLIRAGGKLRARGYALHVVIVGPIFDHQRPYYRQLLALAKECGLDTLLFVGARSDVRALLSRFDIYVCPSVSESWGMALWEAMAMARPVVSTDVGDISYHVEDGESGFVVPVGDADAMADRLSWLIDAPCHRKQIGIRARDVACGYSPTTVAELTLEAYKSILNKYNSAKQVS